MGLHCYRRSSGAAYVLEQEPHSHSVSIGFWFPAGSGTEAESERGFSHFIEHMLFKGTGTRDARSLAGQIERAGGYLNAFTEKTDLCVHCSIPACNWRAAVEILADMAFNSVFDREEFFREKAVIRSEALAARDDPEEDSADEYHARIWEGHPMSRRVAGEPEDIDRIERDALYEYCKAYISPVNLVVTAAGNFIPDEMAGELDRALQDLPEGRKSPQITLPFYRTGSWVKSAPSSLVYFLAGTMIPRRLSREEMFALDVVSCAFGESSSSRLFQKIREEQGLCYSIGTSFACADAFGAFYITAASSAKTFTALLKGVRRELELLKHDGLTEKEAADAVSHLHGQDIVAADDMDTRMRALARQWMRYGSAEPYMVYIDRIRSVDLNQVMDAEETLFARPFSVLAYGKTTQGIRGAVQNNLLSEL